MSHTFPYKRTLMILIDGARPDVLNAEMNKGLLPNMQAHFANRGVNQTMLTFFPSTTGPAYLPYLTGCFPGICNVPGVRWFDKIRYADKGWGFKAFRSYCGLETRLLNSDINPSIKTAWDIFPKAKNIMGGVTRGIKKGHDLTHPGRSLFYYYGHITNRWSFLDSLVAKKLIKLVSEDDFDFVFTVFPGVDEYSHRTSPIGRLTKEAYHQVDEHLGRVVDVLKKRNMYEDTLMIIFSDHGLSATDNHFDIGPWMEETKNIKTLYYSNLLKFNFEAAAMISGNSMCHLYFKGENGWGYRKSFEEISHTSLILDELRLRPEIDLIVSEGANGAVHLQNSLGHGFYHYDQQKDLIWYQFDHTDPLGLFKTGDPRLSNGFSMDEGLKITFNSNYPDVFMQMLQIFKSQRTGDVIVCAKEGYDLRVKYEHPLHKASHGGISPHHMKIPLLMNHPINNDMIRSVDIFPTMLKLVGKEIPEGIDGRCLV